MNESEKREVFRSRLNALVLMAVLFIFFLSATLGLVLLHTDWGQRFASVAPGMDALNLTFGFLIYGMLILFCTALTLMCGGSLVTGGIRLYVDYQASTSSES